MVIIISVDKKVLVSLFEFELKAFLKGPMSPIVSALIILLLLIAFIILAN